MAVKRHKVDVSKNVYVLNLIYENKNRTNRVYIFANAFKQSFARVKMGKTVSGHLPFAHNQFFVLEINL